MRHLKLAASLVAIIIAGFYIFNNFVPRQPRYDPNLDRCIGSRLAAEALKLTGGSGAIVAFTEAETDFKSPMAVALLQGFRDALRQSPSTSLAVEPPLVGETLSQILSQEGLPENVLTDLQAKYPQTKIIVSFLGGPTSRATGTLQAAPPLIALILSPAPSWNDLFAHPALHAVVWKRQGPDADCAKAIAVVTRENVAQFQSR